MAQAPAADQVRLLAVQDLDTAMAQARHRLASLPGLAVIAELESRAGQFRSRRIETETAVGDLRREVTKAEDDVQAVRTRAERDGARLMGGGMTPKELEALQSELTALTKRQSDLEDIELDAMQRLEEAEHLADGAVAEESQVEADLAAARQEVAAQGAVIEAELKELALKRTNEAFGLDVELVALYEKLRTTHGGVGAAALTRGTCMGCRIDLNPRDLANIEARPADDIVRCEECGRILVRGA